MRDLLLAGAGMAVFALHAPALSSDAPTPARLHEDILTLDSHLDAPMNLARPGWSIMDRHSVAEDGSQLDYPRMVEGGLDGGFFAVYIPQGPRTPEGNQAARDAGLRRAVEIREMIAAHADRFELALRAEDAPAIVARGRRVVFMGMENGHPLGQDLSLMKTFHDLGVRMMGPVHFLNNDLGDSATDPKGPEWQGLSPLGRDFVAEANRLGIVLDASHASDAVLDQMLALSKAPIVLSHSGCKAVFDHPRNIDDTRLKALASNGGVIQIHAYSDYMLRPPSIPERDAAMTALRKTYSNGLLSQQQREAYIRERNAIDARYPVPRAGFEDFMAHLLHAIKVAGIDYVGIGIDMDGGGGVTGLDDVADYPRITERLIKEGYSRQDVAKIWSGNLLRILNEVTSKSGR